MGKMRFTIKTNFGSLVIEGENLDDIKSELSTMGLEAGDFERILNSITMQLRRPAEIPSVPTPVPAKPELEGVVEYASDGSPNIIAAPEKLKAREVIGLVLYAKMPTLITLRELTDLVAKNWKSVRIQYISASLAQMRGLIIREGKRGSYTYRLSGSGKSWIESELLPDLKEKIETE